jgi:glucose uptake protein GlcU
MPDKRTAMVTGHLNNIHRQILDRIIDNLIPGFSFSIFNVKLFLSRACDLITLSFENGFFSCVVSALLVLWVHSNNLDRSRMIYCRYGDSPEITDLRFGPVDC